MQECMPAFSNNSCENIHDYPNIRNSPRSIQVFFIVCDLVSRFLKLFKYYAYTLEGPGSSQVM